MLTRKKNAINFLHIFFRHQTILFSNFFSKFLILSQIQCSLQSNYSFYNSFQSRHFFPFSNWFLRIFFTLFYFLHHETFIYIFFSLFGRIATKEKICSFILCSFFCYLGLSFICKKVDTWLLIYFFSYSIQKKVSALMLFQFSVWHRISLIVFLCMWDFKFYRTFHIEMPEVHWKIR